MIGRKTQKTENVINDRERVKSSSSNTSFNVSV